MDVSYKKSCFRNSNTPQRKKGHEKAYWISLAVACETFHLEMLINNRYKLQVCDLDVRRHVKVRSFRCRPFISPFKIFNRFYFSPSRKNVLCSWSSFSSIFQTFLILWQVCHLQFLFLIAWIKLKAFSLNEGLHLNIFLSRFHHSTCVYVYTAWIHNLFKPIVFSFGILFMMIAEIFHLAVDKM